MRMNYFMRIGIDVSSIELNKAGVGYFIYSLLNALLEIDKENEYFLYTNKIQNVEEFNIFENVLIKEIKSEKVDFKWIYSVSKVLRKDVELFISPSNFTFAILNRNVIQVVHDLAPIKFPQFFSKKGAIYYRLQLKLEVRRAKKIISPSESTRQELIQFFPRSHEKFFSISAGLHKWVRESISVEDIDNIKRKYNLPDRFLLTTGTLEPRKNHIKMIKAFKTFSRTNPEYFYVIIGKKGWYYKEIFKTVKQLGLGEKVIFLGYVPEEDLKGIYSNASMFSFCSFYEGFGFPPLEAAKFKLPILCSEIDSLKEIFRESVVYCDPNDVDSIESGLQELVETESLDYEKSLKEFTWDHSAEKLLELINKSK